MSKAQSATQEDGQQSIEELQKRYETLNTRKIKAEADRDNAKKRLDELQKEAREKYGTDDVEKLREKLAEMKSENEKKRREYQQSLEKIESELESVERKFAEAEEPGSEDEDSA